MMARHRKSNPKFPEDFWKPNPIWNPSVVPMMKKRRFPLRGSSLALLPRIRLLRRWKRYAGFPFPMGSKSSRLPVSTVFHQENTATSAIRRRRVRFRFESKDCPNEPRDIGDFRMVAYVTVLRLPRSERSPGHGTLLNTYCEFRKAKPDCPSRLWSWAKRLKKFPSPSIRIRSRSQLPSPMPHEKPHHPTRRNLKPFEPFQKV